MPPRYVSYTTLSITVNIGVRSVQVRPASQQRPHRAHNALRGVWLWPGPRADGPERCGSRGGAHRRRGGGG